MQVNLKLTKEDVAAMKTEKGSKLLPFKGEIVYMRNQGASFSHIQQWLAKHGIDSSSENIRQYYKRYKSDFSDAVFQFKDENTPNDEDEGYKYYDGDQADYPY